MKRNLVIGGLVVVLCAGVAMMAVGGSMVSKVTFADLPHKAGQQCEVYGKLVPESIKSIRGANEVSFDLVEEKTEARLHVLYDNQNSALPANFPAASHAKVSGVYDPTEGRFVGDAVVTKCPSKYDKGNPELANKQPFIEKWQRETGLRADAGSK
jgi:cytochrome c-type biogenesis protein CcmE